MTKNTDLDSTASGKSLRLSPELSAVLNMTLRRPTPELVQSACKMFDEENLVIEEALGELFRQYPENCSLAGVLLKVVSLNKLYSTQILAVMDVARHIHERAAEVDSGLSEGSPLVVETIGLVTLGRSAKKRYNYSFATKYCSWHNPREYPIWDSRVDKYLWKLQKQERFSPDFKRNADLWDYAKFLDVMKAFQEFFLLGAFNFKEIDKFLWSEVLPVSASA